MENREPIAGLTAGYGAALAVLLWALAGVLWALDGDMLLALPSLGLLLLALVVALLATLGSALGTIVEAGHNRDWLSLSVHLVIFALSLVALYALVLDGHPEHTFVDVLYGFSPDIFPHIPSPTAPHLPS